MIAIIGEKPSVAKSIAAIVRANEKHDGYLSGNGYFVTWAFGHLVGLAMPEATAYRVPPGKPAYHPGEFSTYTPTSESG